MTPSRIARTSSRVPNFTAIRFAQLHSRSSYSSSRSWRFSPFKRRRRTRRPRLHHHPRQPLPSPRRLAPLTEKQLENLVSRIALYPDPLLAQILTACTYGNEIPEAAAWADEHSNLKGEALASAIREDNLQWDPSVLALLPFPSVLDMMAKDPAWIEQLGNAVLAQRGDVMDAVQRLRSRRASTATCRRIRTVTSSKPTAIWRSCRSIRRTSTCPITTRLWCLVPRPGIFRRRSDSVGAGGNDHRGIFPFWMGASVYSVGRAHHLFRSHAVESCLGESRLLRSPVRASMGLARRTSRRGAPRSPPEIDLPGSRQSEALAGKIRTPSQNVLAP